MHIITSAQIRGARGMLNWSMMELAKAAGVSVSTVKRFEDAGQAVVSPQMTAVIREALERNGIEFSADEGRGGGLRLNSSVRPETSVFSRFL